LPPFLLAFLLAFCWQFAGIFWDILLAFSWAFLWHFTVIFAGILAAIFANSNTALNMKMLSNCKILQSFHLFNQTWPIDPIHLKKLFQPQIFLNFEAKKKVF
jgi:hypothetical protein